MNNRIDLTKLGKFPATQYTLQFMQDSYRNALAALAVLIGDKVIISGMVEGQGNVTPGWIAVGGELIPFIGGTVASTVIIEEVKESRTFQDGIIKEVYFKKQARFGSGGFPYTDLQRLTTFIALLTNFNNHNHSYNNLSQLPAGFISHVGSHNIGDIIPVGGTSDATYTVAIPNQTTNAYTVTGTMVGNNNNYNASNDISYIIYDKQPESFKIGVREYSGEVQSLRFEFAIIKTQ